MDRRTWKAVCYRKLMLIYSSDKAKAPRWKGESQPARCRERATYKGGWALVPSSVIHPAKVSIAMMTTNSKTFPDTRRNAIKSYQSHVNHLFLGSNEWINRGHINISRTIHAQLFNVYGNVLCVVNLQTKWKPRKFSEVNCQEPVPTPHQGGLFVLIIITSWRFQFNRLDEYSNVYSERTCKRAKELSSKEILEAIAIYIPVKSPAWR